MLFVRTEPAMLAAARPRSIAEGAAYRHAVSRHAMPIGGFIAAQRERDAQRAAGRQAQFGQRRAPGHAARVVLCLQPMRQRRNARARAGSEEHTSELQSLMRTS